MTGCIVKISSLTGREPGGSENKKAVSYQLIAGSRRLNFKNFGYRRLFATGMERPSYPQAARLWVTVYPQAAACGYDVYSRLLAAPMEQTTQTMAAATVRTRLAGRRTRRFAANHFLLDLLRHHARTPNLLRNLRGDANLARHWNRRLLFDPHG